MLTQAQIAYLKGASLFEIGDKYGLRGLEEVREDGFVRKALLLALNGKIPEKELVEKILIKNGVPGLIRTFVLLFEKKGFEKSVIYSAMVSSLGFDYIHKQVEGYEDFMPNHYALGYKLRYATSARKTFTRIVFPEWKEFFHLIEKGVKLRIDHSQKKRNILQYIKEKWGELGIILSEKLK